MNYEEQKKAISALSLPESVRTLTQTKTHRVEYMEKGKPYVLDVAIRWDDECRNGHNSFAVTGTIYGPDRIPHESTTTNKAGKTLWCCGGGCCHELIAKHCPEFAHLIRWHLFDPSGPMHYISNTVYSAGERDCWGTLKGEVRSYEARIRFNGCQISFAVGKLLPFLNAGNLTAETLAPVEVPHGRDPATYGSKFTFAGFPVKAWHECPFDSLRECKEWGASILGGFSLYKEADAWGEGKERELDKARSLAAWPDATDEELTAPGLEKRLIARLPGLVSQMKKDIEAIGFVF